MTRPTNHIPPSRPTVRPEATASEWCRSFQPLWSLLSELDATLAYKLRLKTENYFRSSWWTLWYRLLNVYKTTEISQQQHRRINLVFVFLKLRAQIVEAYIRLRVLSHLLQRVHIPIYQLESTGTVPRRRQSAFDFISENVILDVSLWRRKWENMWLTDSSAEESSESHLCDCLISIRCDTSTLMSYLNIKQYNRLWWCDWVQNRFLKIMFLRKTFSLWIQMFQSHSGSMGLTFYYWDAK